MLLVMLCSNLKIQSVTVVVGSSGVLEHQHHYMELCVVGLYFRNDHMVVTCNPVV